MDRDNFKKEVPVLLVEDDEDDIRLTERAFKKGRISNKLYVVRDGEEAMEFLQHTGRYADSDVPQPGIILLDLNMPRMDGREVLKRLKSDKNLHLIPVIILTTSEEERDILESYDTGANTFITKPVDFDNFLEAIVTLRKYWLIIANLPERCPVMQQ